MPLWPVYTGANEPHDGITQLPPPPPWRAFDGGPALKTPADGDDSSATSPTADIVPAPTRPPSAACNSSTRPCTCAARCW